MSIRHRRDERGIALMSVLAVVLVIAILSGLVLYLTGKEVGLSAVRALGAQAVAIAEGGAFAARSALMAFMNADPIGVSDLDPSIDGTQLALWFAGGVAAAQNSFTLFDYLIVDGQSLTTGATVLTNSVTLAVDWGLPTPHLKLQMGGVPPANPLGTGSYTATVLVERRTVPHATCVGGPCYVHELQRGEEYEFFYTYTITSDGTVPPGARRRVTLSRDFSIRVRRQNFAQYALEVLSRSV